MSEEERSESVAVTLTVNGAPRSLLIDPMSRLVVVLRDDLGLTGTKVGCEVGVCGACTVLVDGRPTSSCIALAVEVDGSDVLTVEGLADHPELERLQCAFVDEGGFQCGYCTSGQLVSAASVFLSGAIETMTEDDVRTHMLGNLCRCTGYYGILRAITAASS